MGQESAAPAPRPERTQGGHGEKRGVEGQYGPMGGEIIRGASSGRRNQNPVADELLEPHLSVENDTELCRLPCLAQERDLVEGERLRLPPGGFRRHQQRMNPRRLGRLYVFDQVVAVEFVHQESDRAEIHAVDRYVPAQERVQRLQHVAVSAERNDDGCLVRTDVIITAAQAVQSGLRFGRFGSDEMELVGHGRKGQPPVSDIWRETAGRLCLRSMTKSCPLGLRPIASSMAASIAASSDEARSGALKSAASSCPRHM